MKFQYQPSFSFVNIILLALGVFLVYYGATSEFDISWRRLTVLRAPFSGYLLIAFGAMIALWGTFNLIQWMTSRGGGSIECTEDSLKFPEYGMTSSKSREIKFSEVTDMFINEGDEFSIILSTQKGSFEFESSLFAREKEYYAFLEEMGRRCTPYIAK